MAIYGYARSAKQNSTLSEQIQSLEAVGCEYVYMDTANLNNRNRPEFSKMMKLIGKGDVLFILDASRVAKDLPALYSIIKKIKGVGADLISLNDTWLDTTAEGFEDTLTVMGYVKEFLGNVLSEKVSVGMNKAKDSGSNIGRPTVSTQKRDHAVELYKEGNLSISDICDMCSISKSTLYRELAKRGITD